MAAPENDNKYAGLVVGLEELQQMEAQLERLKDKLEVTNSKAKDVHDLKNHLEDCKMRHEAIKKRLTGDGDYAEVKEGFLNQQLQEMKSSANSSGAQARLALTEFGLSLLSLKYKMEQRAVEELKADEKSWDATKELTRTREKLQQAEQAVKDAGGDPQKVKDDALLLKQDLDSLKGGNGVVGDPPEHAFTKALLDAQLRQSGPEQESEQESEQGPSPTPGQ